MARPPFGHIKLTQRTDYQPPGSRRVLQALSPAQRIGRGSSCVPSMNDSLEVEVLYPA